VEVIPLHTAKIDTLSEIVQAAQGETMMVVYQFRHEAAAILKAFPYARMMAEDANALAEWNAGKVPMLLVHPASCGFGLNAQFGGHLQVWFTATPDAELYTQTTGRLPRPGQRSPFVRILRLIMKGTKDKYCYNVVEARQRGERVTLDYLEME
jgi:SNF2 family DNA or RNA helicase